MQGGGFGGREVVVRVNALDTPWGEADLAAAVESGPTQCWCRRFLAGESCVRNAAGSAPRRMRSGR